MPAKVEAGKDNVLHLPINSGTDLALFNTLFTYIADQGWIDKDFIANSTFQGDVAVAAGRGPSGGARQLRGGARRMQDVAGRRRRRSAASPKPIIVKAAEWIAKPKDDGIAPQMRDGLREGHHLGQ